MKASPGISAIVVCGLSLLAACAKTDPAAEVRSARLALDKGDYRAAAIEAKNALKTAPNNAEARYLLARALLDAGDATGAETEARKALDLNYSRDEACVVLGYALRRKNEFRRVLSELPKCEATNPQAVADIYATVARAHLGLGDLKAARAFNDKALAQDANALDARILAVELTPRDGDREGALRGIDAVLATAPKNVNALLVKAEILVALDRREDAHRTLEDVIKINPSLAAPRIALIMSYTQANELDKAAAEVQAIKKFAASDPRVQYLASVVALSRGEYAEARDAGLKAQQKLPDDLAVRYVIGVAEYRLGNLRTAEEVLRGLVKRAPDNDAARRALGLVYVERGRPEQAIEVLEPSLRRRPQDPSLLRTMGEAYFAMNDAAKSVEYLDRAVASSKEDVPGRIRAAQARMAAGDPERALNELEALQATHPDSQQTDVALITALVKKRELDKALAAASALERKNPKKPIGANIKGIVYLAKRDAANARASFERALALDPEFGAAAYNLARLDQQEGKYVDARKRYDQLIAKHPDNEQYLLSLAELLAVTNAAPADIVAVINKAVAANPSSPRARIALIRYLGLRKDWPAALAAAQAAQAALPDNGAVLDAVAVAQISGGQANQGIETLRHAARMQPRSIGPLARLAQAQVQVKDFDGAIASLRSALALENNNPELWAAQGAVYVRAGRVDAGLGEAAKLKQNPKRADGWLMEGEIQAMQQKWSEAAAAYKGALERNPSSFTVVRLHAAQLQSAQAKEAQATAQRWFKEHPDDISARVRVGDQLILAKAFQAAAVQLEIAARAAPDNVAILNNLAFAQAEIGDRKALDTASRAYALAPNSPAVTDTYGWILVRQGDVKKGVELLQKAVQLAPDDQAMRVRLATGFIKAGDKASAKREIDAVLASATPKSPARAPPPKTC